MGTERLIIELVNVLSSVRDASGSDHLTRTTRKWLHWFVFNQVLQKLKRESKNLTAEKSNQKRAVIKQVVN